MMFDCFLADRARPRNFLVWIACTDEGEHFQFASREAEWTFRLGI